MQVKTFSEVLALLASAGRVVPVSGDEVGIGYVRQGSDFFVAPAIQCDASPEGSQVLLISAPAAVGKSTFANELAAASHAIIWDLADTQVGTSTFMGGLVRAFGPTALPSVLSGLQKGDTALIIDALDEAHVRSGYRGLEEFVGDIAGQIRNAPANPRVVMFARVETAVLTQLILEGQGIGVTTARIDYFDEASARRFIDKRLLGHWRNLGKQPMHQRNPQLYKEAVDTIFAFVVDCFGADNDRAWEAESVRRFLGYAPVLQAIADYLAVDNMQVVLRELAETPTVPGQTSTGAWSFLLRVVENVINRERGKVLSAIKEQVASASATSVPGWDSWEGLYLADEQIDRVLRRYFHIALFSDQMPVIPSAIRDAYEACLAPSADQHPFLSDSRAFANLVFEAYAFAWALTHGSASVKEVVRRFLVSGSHLSGPLLGRFMLGLAAVDEDGRPMVKAGDTGLLYDSFSAGSGRDDESILWLLNDEADGIQGRISGSQDDDDVVFALDARGSGVQFCRGLAHAEIVVSGGVVLGLPGQPFALGPDVDLETDLIDTPSSEYAILGGIGSFVRLVASEHVNPGNPVELKIHTEGSFAVSWEPLVHPWFGYRTGGDELNYPPGLKDAFDDLVRIVRQFRRHGRDELARKKELIDNVFVGRSNSERTARARRLRSYLMETGVLSETLESKGMYFLDLQRIGLSWADIGEHKMTEDVIRFLEGFLSTSE